MPAPKPWCSPGAAAGASCPHCGSTTGCGLSIPLHLCCAACSMAGQIARRAEAAPTSRSSEENLTMKIAVCIKQVPNTEARLRVSRDGRWLEEEDLPFIINESDE